jgi:hypothetical protein
MENFHWLLHVLSLKVQGYCSKLILKLKKNYYTKNLTSKRASHLSTFRKLYVINLNPKKRGSCLCKLRDSCYVLFLSRKYRFILLWKSIQQVLMTYQHISMRLWFRNLQIIIRNIYYESSSHLLQDDVNVLTEEIIRHYQIRIITWWLQKL